MNDNSPTQHEPLAVELLVTADQRRPRRVSVADHERFHEWTRTGEAMDPDDDIDGLIEEIRSAQPYHPKKSRRR
ncbi:MAG: hypothetical protein ACO3JG_14055 [Luteolibacter sp.]